MTHWTWRLPTTARKAIVVPLALVFAIEDAARGAWSEGCREFRLTWRWAMNYAEGEEQGR